MRRRGPKERLESKDFPLNLCKISVADLQLTDKETKISELNFDEGFLI